MTTNAFAISRRLVEKGVAKETAEAIAEEIVTHSDESLATKADIARIEAKLDAKFNIIIALVSAIFIALVADKFIGG